MSKTSVRQALSQLEEARLVIARVERGNTTARPRDAFAEQIIHNLVDLDRSTQEVHPVPGRHLTDAELALYGQHRKHQPGVYIDEEFPEDELLTPAAVLAIGDPVD